MNLQGKHLNADEVKLLARFLGEPKVQGRIKLLNLRFVPLQIQPQYINLVREADCLPLLSFQ